MYNNFFKFFYNVFWKIQNFDFTESQWPSEIVCIRFITKLIKISKYLWNSMKVIFSESRFNSENVCLGSDS